jgi:putative ATPase
VLVKGNEQGVSCKIFYQFPALKFDQMNKGTPLAERMRPENLDEFMGQLHLVGSGNVLRTLIEKRQVPSMIFWGPPGVGKTTLAYIISKVTDMPFYTLSAISSGVKDVREVIEQAKKSGKAILFIDEIHRFKNRNRIPCLEPLKKESSP